GLGLARGDLRRQRRRPVHALEIEQVADVVDHRDRHVPLVLRRFGLARGDHLLHVRGGQHGFLAHALSSLVCHSAVMPASLIPRAHLLDSASTNAPNCCGVLATTSAPISTRRWRTSLSWSTLAKSSWIRATSSREVAAGSARPNQFVSS